MEWQGAVVVLLFNHSDEDFKGIHQPATLCLLVESNLWLSVNEGDRIAQLVLERIITPEVVEVEVRSNRTCLESRNQTDSGVDSHSTTQNEARMDSDQQAEAPLGENHTQTTKHGRTGQRPKRRQNASPHLVSLQSHNAK